MKQIIENRFVEIKLEDWMVFWTALINFIKIWLSKWYAGGKYKHKNKVIMDWKDKWTAKKTKDNWFTKYYLANF